MSPSPLAALVVLLFAAPVLPAVAARVTARLTGRRGAPLLQPYRDLARLARKGVVFSRSTTWVFGLAPLGVVMTALLASLFLPLDGREAVVSFPGDLVAFAALLALGRFALVLGGLDTGSSFEGMGAGREVAFASFAEPALYAGFLALVLATGQTSLAGMLGAPLGAAGSRVAAPAVMVAVTWFVVMLAEAGRVPVDDPATHLELTMIHEVIVLDHSGPDLALLLYGGALKFALFAALVVGVLLPRASLPGWASVTLLLAGALAVAALVGVLESVMARLRLAAVPQLLAAAAALSALGVILLLR